MRNVELTYGELKDALFYCTVCRSCTNCPLKEDNIETVSAGDPTCTYHLLSAAMNCINIMEKDLADAVKKATEWEAVATSHERTLIELRESLDRANLGGSANG